MLLSVWEVEAAACMAWTWKLTFNKVWQPATFGAYTSRTMSGDCCLIRASCSTPLACKMP
jgi:hypothetical protein